MRVMRVKGDASAGYKIYCGVNLLTDHYALMDGHLSQNSIFHNADDRMGDAFHPMGYNTISKLRSASQATELSSLIYNKMSTAIILSTWCADLYLYAKFWISRGNHKGGAAVLYSREGRSDFATCNHNLTQHQFRPLSMPVIPGFSQRRQYPEVFNMVIGYATRVVYQQVLYGAGEAAEGCHNIDAWGQTLRQCLTYGSSANQCFFSRAPSSYDGCRIFPKMDASGLLTPYIDEVKSIHNSAGDQAPAESPELFNAICLLILEVMSFSGNISRTQLDPAEAFNGDMYVEVSNAKIPDLASYDAMPGGLNADTKLAYHYKRHLDVQGVKGVSVFCLGMSCAAMITLNEILLDMCAIDQQNALANPLRFSTALSRSQLSRKLELCSFVSDVTMASIINMNHSSSVIFAKGYNCVANFVSQCVIQYMKSHGGRFAYSSSIGPMLYVLNSLAGAPFILCLESKSRLIRNQVKQLRLKHRELNQEYFLSVNDEKI